MGWIARVSALYLRVGNSISPSLSSIASVQFSSVAQSCPTLCDPWTAACQASLSITNSQSLLKLLSIELVMPSSHLILSPSIFPSIRDFSNESVLSIRWPKSWNFSFTISPSNEHSGLISFRTDWFDLLAYWVQHFHSIIFQDLKMLNWNSITSTSFVHSDAS